MAQNQIVEISINILELNSKVKRMTAHRIEKTNLHYMLFPRAHLKQNGRDRKVKMWKNIPDT